jgi:F420H(2)-dependent quinone reductase
MVASHAHRADASGSAADWEPVARCAGTGRFGVIRMILSIRQKRGANPGRVMGLAKWLYRGGRPNQVARILNRCWAAIHALGIAPNYLVSLEVSGRRSGRIIRLPLVMVVIAGERYLVSMLGEEVNWVRNVRAARGNVTLRHGRREEVRLEEVPADRRAPVLKACLKRAPGARPHLPIHKDAPLAEFEQLSSRFAVFRVVPRTAGHLSAEQVNPVDAR